MASIGPSTITGTPPAARSYLVSAEELGALVEQRSVGGVEVFRAAAVGVGEIGVSAADEPEHLAVVDDREDDAVAEPVDETAGAGDGGHPGGDHLLVGDAAAAEMVDQSGPAGRGLAGPEARVIGQVLAEPVSAGRPVPRRRGTGCGRRPAPAG